jgi:hypothetical protein
MHVASPHRLCPLLDDTEHRLKDPVVPAVLGPDRRNCLLGDAVIGAISGARKLDAQRTAASRPEPKLLDRAELELEHPSSRLRARYLSPARRQTKPALQPPGLVPVATCHFDGADMPAPQGLKEGVALVPA